MFVSPALWRSGQFVVANVANVYVAIIRTAQRAGIILHKLATTKTWSWNSDTEINKSSWSRSDISSEGRELYSVCYQCWWWWWWCIYPLSTRNESLHNFGFLFTWNLQKKKTAVITSTSISIITSTSLSLLFLSDVTSRNRTSAFRWNWHTDVISHD